MSPGSAGTAGNGFRVDPPIGRHRAPPPQPEPAWWRIEPTRRRVGTLAIGAAIGIVGPPVWLSAVAIAPDATAAATPHPAAIPTERADDPGARAGRYQRPVTPTIVASDAPVWDEGKGPVIVNGQPLRTTTAARPAPARVAPVVEPAPAEPPPPEPPTSAAEPPPVIGLPPVDETPPEPTPTEPEQPPAEDPEDTPEDTPDVSIEIVTEPEPTP